MLDTLLDIATVAEQLGKTRSAVQRYIHSGYLPAVRPVESPHRVFVQLGALVKSLGDLLDAGALTQEEHLAVLARLDPWLERETRQGLAIIEKHRLIMRECELIKARHEGTDVPDTQA